VSRWRALERELGDVRPGPLGGDHRSDPIKAKADLIRKILDQMGDTTTDELRHAIVPMDPDVNCESYSRLMRESRP
jgi:hypothetical protein